MAGPAFNNSINSIGVTTRTAIYTVPATGVASATVIGITVCNVSTTSNAKFTIDAEGASVVQNLPLTPGNGYNPLDGSKIVLLPGESIFATSDLPLHTTVSVMEYA